MTNASKEPDALQGDRTPTGDVRIWQQRLVRGVLRALVVVGLLAVVVSSYYAYTQQLLWLIPFYWAAYLLILVMAFWRRAPYAAQVWSMIIMFYVLAFFDFATEGRGASARLFLLCLSFAAALFLGRREAFLSLVVIFLTSVGFAWAFSTGFITDYQEVDSTDPTGWASNIFVLVMLGTLIVVSLNYLVPRLGESLAQSRKLARELEEQRVQLEVQVEARTADLARRSAQLEAASQVARDAAAIREVRLLLQAAVDLISERMGFYHAGIFLLDDRYAVLRAASSEGGRRMLERGHQLEIGGAGSGEPVGIVGHVAGSGQPRIALDVGEDAVFFDNPDLPNTHSEMAVPLLVGQRVVGVLDVQSVEPEAFSEQDVTVLQTLADQLTLALENARLLQETQERLQQISTLASERERTGWQRLAAERPAWGYTYDGMEVVPTEQAPAVDVAAGAEPELSVPLRVRQATVGRLDLGLEGRTPTSEEVELAQAVADRVGQALERARLFQETQHRAAQEQLIAEVTDKMRRAGDMDTLMQVAVREMAAALGTPNAFVQFGRLPGAPDEQNSDT